MRRKITLSCLAVFVAVFFVHAQSFASTHRSIPVSQVMLQPCTGQFGYSLFTFLPDKTSFHFGNTTGITEYDINSLANIFLNS